jgi:hypothetical protein
MTDIKYAFEQLQRSIAKPSNSKDRCVREAMLVLIAAAQQGTDIPTLVNRTGMPEEFVIGIADRMRAAGLWTDVGVDSSEWLDGKDLDVFLLIDESLLALGDQRRLPRTDACASEGVDDQK